MNESIIIIRYCIVAYYYFAMIELIKMDGWTDYGSQNCVIYNSYTYHSPHFCFPWRRPCDYHAICCMDGKTIQCLPNLSQHIPIYLEYFPSYTMLKSMRKSKNRYFYYILVSPGNDPKAITLNVVWTEREFDAYKLSRKCTHLSSTVSQLFELQVQKNRCFHAPHPTFLFPLETPLRLSRNMLHGWKENSMLAKPLAACTYLYSILS